MLATSTQISWRDKFQFCLPDCPTLDFYQDLHQPFLIVEFFEIVKWQGERNPLKIKLLNSLNNWTTRITTIERLKVEIQCKFLNPWLSIGMRLADAFIVNETITITATQAVQTVVNIRFVLVSTLSEIVPCFSLCSWQSLFSCLPLPFPDHIFQDEFTWGNSI